MGLVRVLRLLRYFVMGAVGSAALVWAAVGAMYVTSAPKWVTLLVEPESLFLLPGLVVAIVVAGQHDLSATVVVEASAGFYFLAFFVWFWWRGRWARRPVDGGSG